ncbi:MAG: 16S rRNA (uracil(1498)-N(3))-methyltransferase [Candidatus Omnitrophica bacterium]|nr:16S rRNA (uracil(1498)-N(3))-methyltransferase [Candidatus Omnitrophota bacterium]
MTLPRFYLPSGITLDTRQLSLKDEIHHALHVLRLKADDRIIVFDGKGHEATATIHKTDKNDLYFSIDQMNNTLKNQPKIILACAIPKKTKFEWILEKSTELGCDEIIPLITDHMDHPKSISGSDKKLSRYKSVILNACKQSQRAFIPDLQKPVSLKELIHSKHHVHAFKIVGSLPEPHENISTIIHQFKNEPSVILFIGPEGDFSQSEYALLKDYGSHPLTLGNTILKVETAAIAALSYIMLTLRS